MPAEPPAAQTFSLGELISGPVHLMVDRGTRPFARTDAERIVSVVLTGIRNTGAKHALVD